MTRWRHIAILLVPILLAQTNPTTRPAEKTAEIGGTLTSSAKVLRLCAVDREWADVLKTSEKDPHDKFLYDAKFTALADGKSTAFVIPGLLAGRTYDLVVWTQAGGNSRTRWEGVNMDYHRDIKPDDKVTADDQKWLADFVK